MKEEERARSANCELDDTGLAGVDGGVVVDAGGNGDTTILITSGVQCGTKKYATGAIIYRPCPRCGKPMHTEWYTPKWYCDPCNFSEFRPRAATWNGTEQELIAAAR